MDLLETVHKSIVIQSTGLSDGNKTVFSRLKPTGVLLKKNCKTIIIVLHNIMFEAGKRFGFKAKFCRLKKFKTFGDLKV